MIIIFLAVILLGLSYFGYVFSKEMKSGIFDGSKAAGTSLRELKGEPAEFSSSGILGERYSKLEKLLEEKSRSLVKIEQELFNERAHRSEFESLKDILQRQIEDLKSQNRRLKEGQAKKFVPVHQAHAIKSTAEAPMDILPVKVVDQEKFDQFFDSKGTADQPVSLHDIFDKKDASG